jgi:hypothetical protein
MRPFVSDYGPALSLLGWRLAILNAYDLKLGHAPREKGLGPIFITKVGFYA